MQHSKNKAAKQLLRTVKAAAKAHTGHKCKVFTDSPREGVVMYASPSTVAHVFSQALQQLQAQQVQGLPALLTADGQEDQTVTFTLHGHNMYLTTCYEED